MSSRSGVATLRTAIHLLLTYGTSADRVNVIKILGVTMTNGLSVSPHVQSVIASCAQVLYALRVLRAHGLCDSALHTIYTVSQKNKTPNSCT